MQGHGSAQIAPASKALPLSESANAWLGIRDPLSADLEEADLVAMRAFFELLAEWESKEIKRAHINQS